jgi:hypothetical protein
MRAACSETVGIAPASPGRHVAQPLRKAAEAATSAYNTPPGLRADAAEMSAVENEADD